MGFDHILRSISVLLVAVSGSIVIEFVLWSVTLHAQRELFVDDAIQWPLKHLVTGLLIAGGTILADFLQRRKIFSGMVGVSVVTGVSILILIWWGFKGAPFCGQECNVDIIFLGPVSLILGLMMATTLTVGLRFLYRSISIVAVIFLIVALIPIGLSVARLTVQSDVLSRLPFNSVSVHPIKHYVLFLDDFRSFITSYKTIPQTVSAEEWQADCRQYKNYSFGLTLYGNRVATNCPLQGAVLYNEPVLCTLWQEFRNWPYDTDFCQFVVSAVAASATPEGIAERKRYDQGPIHPALPGIVFSGGNGLDNKSPVIIQGPQNSDEFIDVVEAYVKANFPDAVIYTGSRWCSPLTANEIVFYTPRLALDLSFKTPVEFKDCPY